MYHLLVVSYLSVSFLWLHEYWPNYGKVEN